MIYKALFLSLIALNLAASNAGASSAAAAAASASATSSSATESDEKGRKAICSMDFDGVIRQALRSPYGTNNYASLLAVRDAGPGPNSRVKLLFRCCKRHPDEFYESPLRHLDSARHDRDMHAIACVLGDTADPVATHVTRSTFSTIANMLFFNIENPGKAVGCRFEDTVLHDCARRIRVSKQLHPDDLPTKLCAARYFVANGVDPDHLNFVRRTALDQIDNDETLRAQFATEIEIGKKCYAHALKSQPTFAHMQGILVPLSGAFNNLAVIIQAYVGLPKNPKLIAVLNRLRAEALAGNTSRTTELEIAQALLPDNPETSCLSK